MGTRNIKTADAGPTVGDVMLVGPDTVAPTTTVAEARAYFESPKHKLLLVTDGPRYVGSILRDSTVLDGADDRAPIAEYVQREAVPTLTPGDPTDRLYDVAEQHDLNRIPVVGPEGELKGLVCYNRTAGSFCVA